MNVLRLIPITHSKVIDNGTKKKEKNYILINTFSNVKNNYNV